MTQFKTKINRLFSGRICNEHFSLRVHWLLQCQSST